MQAVFDLFKTGLDSSLSWFVTGLNYTGAGPYIIGIVTAMLVVSLLIAPIRGVSYLSFGGNESKHYNENAKRQAKDDFHSKTRLKRYEK